MRIKKKNDKQLTSIVHKALAGASLAMLPAIAFAAVEFHPHSTVSVSWIDNLTLVGDNDPAKQSDYVGQVNPGFILVQDGQRLNTSLKYTMQNVFFKEDSDRNSTFHQGEAAVEAELLQDYFFVEASGSYSQQLVDPRLPANTNNLFGIDNQADALAAQASTILRHDFDAFRADLSYTRGLVDFKEAASVQGRIEDADTDTYSGLLGSVDEFARVTWEARYDSQRVKYELALPYRFDSAMGELGVLTTNSLRLIGRYGRESDIQTNTAAGGLDLETWEAGIRFLPGPSTRLEAFYGDHFYGESYTGRFHHEARFASWDFSYTEGPMTQAQEIALRPVATDLLEQRVVDANDETFVRQGSAVFLRKVGEARVSLRGRRTEISLFATDYRRRYLAGQSGDEHLRSGALEIARTLSQATQFLIGGRVAETDLDTGETFKEVSSHIGLQRKLSDRISAGINATHLRRTGLLDFRVNVVTASITGQL